MGNALSQKPKLEVTETDKAVLALKSQRRRLLDQQKRAVAQIDRETEVARQLIASGHKDRARLALKKRHIQQQTVDKLDGLLLNVESMLAEVETVANQARLMSALSQGNEALKQMQKAVTLDDVEKLTQDTADAREYQEQLQRVLGQASWSPEDEAATEADLAALEGQLAAEMAEEMPKVPEGVVQPAKKEKAEEELPSVPTHVPLAQGAKQAQRAEPIAAS